MNILEHWPPLRRSQREKGTLLNPPEETKAPEINSKDSVRYTELCEQTKNLNIVASGQMNPPEDLNLNNNQPRPYVIETKVKKLSCKVCGQFSTRNRQEMVDHVDQIHLKRNEKNKKCPYCPEMFARVSERTLHKTQAHP